VLVVPHETFAPQMPATHAPEQHSVGTLQLDPSGLHGGGGGGGTEPQTPFAWQYWLQHCVDELHGAPLGSQGGGGGGDEVHTPPAQTEGMQHSTDDEQIDPFDLQIGGDVSLFESGPPESTPESVPSSIFPPHAT